LSKVLNFSFKFIVLNILLLCSYNIKAENDMPLEVQDMITQMTEGVSSGKARQDIKQGGFVASPYDHDYAKKKAVANKQKKLSKARFLLDFKVISCQREKLPEYLKDKKQNHDAC